MILKDDGDSGSEGTERQNVARKAEAVHMQDVRGEFVQKVTEGGIPGRRETFAEEEEVVTDAVAGETLDM